MSDSASPKLTQEMLNESHDHPAHVVAAAIANEGAGDQETLKEAACDAGQKGSVARLRAAFESSGEIPTTAPKEVGQIEVATKNDSDESAVPKDSDNFDDEGLEDHDHPASDEH